MRSLFHQGRITLRSAMLFVALVALTVASISWVERIRYRWRAYTEEAADWAIEANTLEHLVNTYDTSAGRPWIPVPPDPSAPAGDVYDTEFDLK
jgi:hypothetical protein